MKDDDLIRYNQMGLIPGPHEDEKQFLARVDYCLHLKEKLVDESGLDIPEELAPLPEAMVTDASAVTMPLFDMFPRWVLAAFSNQGLTPWHGGCAWIFQLTDQTPLGAFFQLRRAFAKQKTYLGLYDRTELIAHESVHVGRMQFEEPRFEEFHAYRTSKSAFRRWFGPILQSAWEGLIFLFSLFLVVVLELFLTFSDITHSFNLVLWGLSIPSALLVMGLGRLAWRHWTYQRCWSKLNKALDSAHKANAVLFRLQDHEIILFSKLDPSHISCYADEQKTLRWHLIRIVYFT